MAKTMIAYTYRRGDLPPASRIAVQGPVYCDDDGMTTPWVQAVMDRSRHSYFGRVDAVVTAERVPAPDFGGDE